MTVDTDDDRAHQLWIPDEYKQAAEANHDGGD